MHQKIFIFKTPGNRKQSKHSYFLKGGVDFTVQNPKIVSNYQKLTPT
jgi:hypothetical protein